MNEQTEWRNVSKWAKTEIIRLGNTLEADLDIDATNKVRGEIKAIRRLLALGEEPDGSNSELIYESGICMTEEQVADHLSYSMKQLTEFLLNN